jgi:hypothetical protein
MLAKLQIMFKFERDASSSESTEANLFNPTQYCFVFLLQIFYQTKSKEKVESLVERFVTEIIMDEKIRLTKLDLDKRELSAHYYHFKNNGFTYKKITGLFISKFDDKIGIRYFKPEQLDMFVLAYEELLSTLIQSKAQQI